MSEEPLVDEQPGETPSIEAQSWEELLNEDAALTALKARGLSAESEAQLFSYCQLLHEFDSHTNLVANSSLPVLLKEHVLDSLQLLPWVKEANRHSPRLIDVGTGAGFPGMVLAIAHPLVKLTLVESIGKKCRFLESVVTALNLSSRVQVICERAETLGHDRKLRERFDLATARAVGALPMVAELCLPFLRVGGTLLAQRSKRQALEEHDEADAYFSRLGGMLLKPVNFEPDLLGRELSLFVVAKKRTTPPTYPRNAAQMKKGR